eukprot:g45246.t1
MRPSRALPVFLLLLLVVLVLDVLTLRSDVFFPRSPRQQPPSSWPARAFGLELEFKVNSSLLSNESAAAVAEVLDRAGLRKVWAGPHRLRKKEDQAKRDELGVRIVMENGYGLIKSTPLHLFPAEAVTAKLEGQAGELEVRALLRALASVDATIDESGHVHVHVDASDLSFDHLHHLAVCFILHEPLFDNITAWHCRRDRNKFAKSNLFGVSGGWNVTEAVLKLSKVTESQDLYRKFNRKRAHTSAFKYTSSVLTSSIHYYKLNLPIDKHAYGDKGRVTVEWRQHQGSTEPDELLTWLRLVVGFVEGAKADFLRHPEPQQRYCKLGLEPSISSLLSFAGFREPGLEQATKLYELSAEMFDREKTRRLLPHNRATPGTFKCDRSVKWRDPESHLDPLIRWQDERKGNSQGCMDLEWSLADEQPCLHGPCFDAS